MDENKELEQQENAQPLQAELAEAGKDTAKRKNIITVAVCAVIVVIAVVVAVLFVNNGGKDKPAQNESQSASEQVSAEVVTDENGEAVIDENGNVVTQQPTTAKGGSSGSGSSSDADANDVDEQTTTETTTAKKAEKRKLNIYIVTPFEDSSADTAVIYVNGEEDCRIDVALDGRKYFAQTSEKYKGEVEVKVLLEGYNVAWVLNIGELYDTETFNIPLNHVEEGIAEEFD